MSYLRRYAVVVLLILGSCSQMAVAQALPNETSAAVAIAGKIFWFGGSIIVGMLTTGGITGLPL